MSEPVFSFIGPDPASSPLVLDSPHSGQLYPNDLAFACDMHMLRQTEDTFVDELFSLSGAPMLRAHFARGYVDANRAEDDIDPNILDGPFPGPLNPSDRSMVGHGLIRHNCRGQDVYGQKIPVGVARMRIETYYRPYHAALAGMLAKSKAAFGKVWHINCHSMSSSDIHGLSRISPAFGRPRADFVLGDRDGTTAEPALVQLTAQFLRKAGYTIGINDPYKGMEILRRSGKPHLGLHSLQLEINRGLYLNEETLEKNSGFLQTQTVLTELVQELQAHLLRERAEHKLAAE